MKKYIFTEAIKVKEGKFYDLQMHIERMQQTTLHFFGKSTIFSLSEDIIPVEKREGLFKCRIVYSDKIVSVEFTPYTFRTINKLSVIDGNNISYSYKWADRGDLIDLLDCKGECDDILIIKDGLVTDTSFSNVVFENESGLYTPTSYLLNGTKRRYLLAQRIVEERVIAKDDILSFSKIHIINSMIDLEDEIWLPISGLEYHR